MVKPTCNDCCYLIKDYLDDSKLAFTALCDKTKKIHEGKIVTPIISYKTGAMLSISTPNWCPLSSNTMHGAIEKEENVITKKFEDLSYYEQNNFLKTLPKHVEWCDVKEGELYVLPKIRYSKGKLYKVELKTDYLIRMIEVDDSLNPLSVSKNIYKTDCESSFLVAYHKY